ncbi:hypothetical protein [Maridesulfovibrio salexigens]|uniref:Uncharacterized protein n=1 Tax=Maridesulfovibrio salexigens (strain ATCC 14822 / DSM 2638 / NCIMB 8403 / VKM B-1763) TaxID=526222 RepID=C6BRP4_MARSD|nr:hypothetical protein [Maridesulfovibrio salexigens]ACS79484.1 hypothetical protein Desal_1422 [Maridesulfovibrio salexigens DSM 2638]
MGQDCEFCGENLDDTGYDHEDGTYCGNCSTMNEGDWDGDHDGGYDDYE